MIPAVRVLCGISAGKDKQPHGRSLAVIGIDGQRLVDIKGVFGPLSHATGTRWKMIVCPKHGVLAVTERQVLKAYEHWARNPHQVARVSAKQRVSAARLARP